GHPVLKGGDHRVLGNRARVEQDALRRAGRTAGVDDAEVIVWAALVQGGRRGVRCQVEQTVTAIRQIVDIDHRDAGLGGQCARRLGELGLGDEYLRLRVGKDGAVL